MGATKLWIIAVATARARRGSPTPLLLSREREIRRASRGALGAVCLPPRRCSCTSAATRSASGPIAWLLISEIFPLSVRGQAVFPSLAVQTNLGSNVVVSSLAFAGVMHALGNTLTFGTFFALTLYSLYFVHAHVPETKGLTLEQIEQLFAKRSGEKRRRRAAAVDTAEERALLSRTRLRGGGAARRGCKRARLPLSLQGEATKGGGGRSCLVL